MSIVRRARSTSPATLVWAAKAQHAETPLWDASRDCVDFIDGVGGELLSLHVGREGSGDPDTPTRRRRRVAAELGFARTTRDTDRLLCGIGTRIGLIPREGAALATPWQAAGDERMLRFNDSGCDAQGRLWTGTMCRRGADPLGTLYRLADGALTPMVDGFRIPNGFAFDRACATLYVADSPLRVIHAFSLGADGVPRSRREFFTCADAAWGFPDGMATDAEDHLWVAFYEGGCVRRLRPDGSVERTVPLPARLVTACAFGGADLRTLYITADGGLFALQTEVAGLPITPAAF